tara:strand:- start:378 stop:857 length:480 start_codon:yes stop_codon:yes gene_type:complete
MIKKKEINPLILFGIFILLIIFAISIAKYSEFQEKKTKNKNINLIFNTNVAKDLPWQFSTKQSYVNSKIGQVYRVEFNVENEGQMQSSGKAVYEIRPNFFKEYFVEMDCFCYKKQTLLPGEKSKYSVTFYVDDSVLKNSKVEDINEVNILYTFFKVKDL